jgi:transcriptional regulator with XRE-family HTH domain
MVSTSEIRVGRARLGYTQREMADLIGIKTVAAYSKKERGITQFKAEEWSRLVDLFGWSSEEADLVLHGRNLPKS